MSEYFMLAALIFSFLMLRVSGGDSWQRMGRRERITNTALVGAYSLLWLPLLLILVFIAVIVILVVIDYSRFTSSLNAFERELSQAH